MTWNVATYVDGLAKEKESAYNKLIKMKNAQQGKYGNIEEKNIEVEHSAIDF
jgi:hypothetical protein